VLVVNCEVRGRARTVVGAHGQVLHWFGVQKCSAAAADGIERPYQINSLSPTSTAPKQPASAADAALRS